MGERDKYEAVFEDGTIIRDLTFQESYDLFKKHHKTANQCRVHSHEYGTLKDGSRIS
jgi:hypothetical protein